MVAGPPPLRLRVVRILVAMRRASSATLMREARHKNPFCLEVFVVTHSRRERCFLCIMFVKVDRYAKLFYTPVSQTDDTIPTIHKMFFLLHQFFPADFSLRTLVARHKKAHRGT